MAIRQSEDLANGFSRRQWHRRNRRSQHIVVVPNDSEVDRESLLAVVLVVGGLMT